MVERRKPGSPLRPTKLLPSKVRAKASADANANPTNEASGASKLSGPIDVSEPRRAIEALVYAYAERIDAGDFAAVASLLGRAVVRAGGQVLADRDEAAVQRMYEATTRRYEDGTPRTRHVVTNLMIDFDEQDPGAASARSTFTVYQALPDFPLQAVIAGRYHDRFVCERSIWRFDEREIITELFGDLSRHLLIPIPR